MKVREVSNSKVTSRSLKVTRNCTIQILLSYYTIRHDTIWYIYVHSEVNEMASLI